MIFSSKRLSDSPNETSLKRDGDRFWSSARSHLFAVASGLGAVAVAGDGLHRALLAAVVSSRHMWTGDSTMWCGLNLFPKFIC